MDKWLGYLFRNATNLSNGIFKSGDITRGNLSSHYVTCFQRAGLRNSRPLEFCGIFMNEDISKFSVKQWTSLRGSGE